MKEKFPKKFLAIVLSMFLLMFLFVGSYATDSGGITQLFSSTKTSETTTVTDRNSTTIRPSTTENHSTTTTAYQTITSTTDTATSATKVTITDVDISETVYRYDWLLYKVINDEVTIVGAVDAVGEKEVPAEIDGYPVRIIDDWAFIQCSRLTAITVSETVTSIGEGAFFCCENIKIVKIPASVTKIGVRAFFRCQALGKIEVSDKNQYFSNDSNGVLFSKDKTVLIQYPVGSKSTDYIIPKSVHTIKDYAFSGANNLVSVLIPDSVQTIGDCAFGTCDNLIAVEIPSSVSCIGERAFSSCLNLERITVDAENLWYSSDEYGVLYDKWHTKLLQYPLGNKQPQYTTRPIEELTVTKDSFYGCRYLERLDLLGVVEIESHSIASCFELKELVMHTSLRYIDDSGISACEHLSDIYFKGTDRQFLALESQWHPFAITSGAIWHYLETVTDGYLTYDIVDGKATVVDCDSSASGEVVIPAEINGYPVVAVGQYAFKDCDLVTDVVIGDNVTTLARQSFADCKMLKNVVFSDSLITIGAEAFRNCSSLKEITIPANVENIYGFAFVNTLIEHVYVETDLPVIDFGNDSIEKNAVIHYLNSNPEKLKKGDFTFEITDEKATVVDCWPGEGTVEIPSEICGYPVTEIGSDSINIYNDDGHLIIPASVTHISESAFAWASSLASITVDTDNPNYSSDEYGVLFNKDKTVLINFPEGSGVTVYNVPYGVVELAEWSFKGSNVVNVTVPETVKKIGAASFYWCSKLESFVIPEGVTVIEDFTFAECFELTSVSVPDGIVKIGVAAFQNCSVEEIYLPESLVSVDESNFKEEENPFDENVITLKRVYYGGSKEDWEKVTVEEWNNDALLTAEIFYNRFGITEVSVDSDTGISVEYPKNENGSLLEIVVEESNSESTSEIIDANIISSAKTVFDIVITKGGVEIRPDSNVVVRIPLPEGYDPEKTVVYHIDTEKGTMEDLNAVYENGYLVFETDHFGYYAVVEKNGDFIFKLRTPSATTVSYGDTIMLHADISGPLPEDFYIGWSTNNDCFAIDVSEKGSVCKLSPASSGDTVITATVYDEEGNEVCSDTQLMTSKAGFFHKIIGFFKGLFGLTKDYEW